MTKLLQITLLLAAGAIAFVPAPPGVYWSNTLVRISEGETQPHPGYYMNWTFDALNRRIARGYLFGVHLMPWHHTWTLVHHTENGANCASGASSPCAMTVTSTTAGNLLIGVFNMHNTGASATSITGGTSVHPTGCQTGAASDARSTDVAYVLSATGGSTSITFTWSTGTSDGFEELEYSYTSAPASFDVCSKRDVTVAATNLAGVSAGTLTGTNDVIIQYGGFTGSATGCPNSAASPAAFPNGDAVCGLINSTNSAAGTYTNTSSTAALGAIAFKEAAAATAHTMPPAVY